MRNPFAVALAASVRPPVRSQGITSGGALVPAFQNRVPQWSQWSTRKAIEEGLKVSSWVYVCIDRLMKAAGMVRWGAYQRSGDDTWELERRHPLTTLIRKPNPFMSGTYFMKMVTAQLYLAGNAMLSHIRVSRTGKIPVELWPIWELDKITVVADQATFIDRYEFRRDGEPIPILPDQVTHLMFPDPGNPFWGLSPLKAGARTVDTDVEAVRWNKLLLQNRAVSDGVFTIPGITDMTQFEEARQMVREQYSGADNARMPWVLGNAEYHQLSMTPAELDYLESRKFSVEEIGALFGVPVPLIMAKDATFANMDTARKLFWEDTVIPFLNDVQETLNQSITPYFGDADDLELRYDTANVPAMRENMTEKVTNLKNMTSSGVPLNKALQRLEMGIDDVDGGDVGLVLATMVPITMAGEMQTPDDPRDPGKPNDPAPTPAPRKSEPLPSVINIHVPPIEMKAGDTTLHLTVPPAPAQGTKTVTFEKNQRGELVAAEIKERSNGE